MTARILIIAGSDSGGGAGIQADIKTVTMLGGHAMTAITAITAQNTLGVTGVHPIPTDMVIAQIDAVVSDIGVDAIKIGMIGSAETANAVADRIGSIGAPIVFDPVMIATSGSVLADDATIAAFGRLMALASLATPNLPELEALACLSVTDETGVQQAADAIMDRTGCPAILAKGGHLTLQGQVRSKNEAGEEVVHDCADLVFDFLYSGGPDGYQEWSWADTRIDTTSTHGTGCTLASAIATGLGQGLPLIDAIARARAFVRAALLAAPGLGQGHGPMGHQAVRL